MLFSKYFALDLCFQAEHCLFEEDQKSAGTIKLINKLVTFFKQLCIYQIFQILASIIDSALHVGYLLIFDIDQPFVVTFFLCKKVSSRFQFFLSIFNNIATEFLYTLIDVFLCEYPSRT